MRDILDEIGKRMNIAQQRDGTGEGYSKKNLEEQLCGRKMVEASGIGTTGGAAQRPLDKQGCDRLQEQTARLVDSRAGEAIATRRR